MGETLTELIAKISIDAAGLKSGLSDAEKQTEASSKKMADSLKKVGQAMAASGAAITAALGLMGKAAIDEEINIKRLATTIDNSGTAYDSVKDSMEALIATTQRKTGVADNEQRNILNRLILVTNDYKKALELLPTVLDLAAAGEMDATTAATYLGKAFLELEDGAESVSVRFGQASLQFKNMEDIQNRVRGAAENLANPLSVLKASIGDVAEAIGANLIPLIKDAVNKIVDISLKIQDWAKEHPELAKTLTLVVLALGAVLTVVGGLILAMPVITSMVAAFGVVFHAALGPIGLISLAIMALIAIGIALYDAFKGVETQATATIDPLKELEAQLAATKREASKLAEEAEKASDKAIKALDRLATETVNALKERNREMERIDKESLQDRLDDLKNFTRQTIQEYQEATDEIIRDLERRRDVEISHNKELITSENERHRLALGNLSDEAKAKRNALSADAKIAIKKLKTQIDAIREGQEAADDAVAQERDRIRANDLLRQWQEAKAKGDKNAALRLEEEYEQARSAAAIRIAKRERQAQIDSLNAQIDAIGEKAENDKAAIDAKLEQDKKAEEAATERQIAHYEKAIKDRRAFFEGEITDAKTNLKDKLDLLDNEVKIKTKNLENEGKELAKHYENLNKAETLQAEARRLILEENQEELVKLLNSYNPQWQDAGVSLGTSLLKGLQSTKASIQAEVSSILSLMASAQTATAYAIGAQGDVELAEAALAEATAPVEVPEMARGGIVTRPTLVLAGEHGAEAIVPLNEAMGLTINFNAPVYGFEDFESKVAAALKDHILRGGFHGVLKGA